MYSSFKFMTGYHKKAIMFVFWLAGVYNLVMKDELIRVFARHQILRKPGDLTWVETNDVRGKLRFLGRLLKEMHANTAQPLSFREYLKPQFFNAFRTSVLNLRTENKQLAFTLGPYIKKLCLLNISEAIKRHDHTARDNSKDFLDIFNSEWTETVSSSTLRLQQKAKINRNMSSL